MLELELMLEVVDAGIGVDAGIRGCWYFEFMLEWSLGLNSWMLELRLGFES